MGCGDGASSDRRAGPALARIEPSPAAEAEGRSAGSEARIDRRAGCDPAAAEAAAAVWYVGKNHRPAGSGRGAERAKTSGIDPGALSACRPGSIASTDAPTLRSLIGAAPLASWLAEKAGLGFAAT